MKKVSRFQVVQSSREPPSVQLRRDDSGTLISLDAANLLAQYEFSSKDVLLVLDEDCPYEEQLHLALIRDDAVIDHIVIGAPFATGAFKEVGVGNDMLRFSFAGDGVLRVAVGADRGWLPQSLPEGARRRGGWLTPRVLRLSSEGQQA